MAAQPGVMAVAGWANAFARRQGRPPRQRRRMAPRTSWGASRLVYFTVKLHVTVIGSRRQLFAYLADFTTNAEWDPNTCEAKRLSGDPRNPTKGDVFELITLFRALFKGSADELEHRGLIEHD